MTESIIITAGGIGKRMGTKIPKQFIEIDGLPILMYTINKFYLYNTSIEIIVVLPAAHIEYWQQLIEKHNFKIVHTIVEGGKERFYSIKNGLKHVTGEIIGIHDGVRPFVSNEVIKNLFETAKLKKAVIPVIDIKESIRELHDEDSIAVDRSNYKIVQTPQCFTKAIIQNAYLQDFSPKFTDDASVVESTGQSITLIKGNDENIKLTTPLDLKLAEILIGRN